MIAELKKDIAIWNINSFAEFYMQIEEKYRKDYISSLAKLRKERKRYEKELAKIDGLRIIPSQANFIMAEITNGITATELTQRMNGKHHILIKDLSAKITRGGKQYVRLAIRNAEENDRLIRALGDELCKGCFNA